MWQGKNNKLNSQPPVLGPTSRLTVPSVPGTSSQERRESPKCSLAFTMRQSDPNALGCKQCSGASRPGEKSKALRPPPATLTLPPSPWASHFHEQNSNKENCPLALIQGTGAPDTVDYSSSSLSGLLCLAEPLAVPKGVSRHSYSSLCSPSVSTSLR